MTHDRMFVLACVVAWGAASLGCNQQSNSGVPLPAVAPPPTSPPELPTEVPRLVAAGKVAFDQGDFRTAVALLGDARKLSQRVGPEKMDQTDIVLQLAAAQLESSDEW